MHCEMSSDTNSDWLSRIKHSRWETHTFTSVKQFYRSMKVTTNEKSRLFPVLSNILNRSVWFKARPLFHSPRALNRGPAVVMEITVAM